MAPAPAEVPAPAPAAAGRPAPAREPDLLRDRRARIDGLAGRVPALQAGHAAGPGAGAAPAPAPAAPTSHWGLALSGGGIRSATFALGVLQAIAEAPAGRDAQAPGGAAATAPGAVFRRSLLSRFDYLSTVSGGGYIGAFLCSLFVPDRLRHQGGDALRAADDATRVMQSGAPGRIHAAGDYQGDRRLTAPLAWLRENGRYLAPTGFGDAVYAAALGIRNWMAVHFVVGTALIAVLALLALVRAALRPWTHCWEVGGFQAAAAGQGLAAIWWSPVLLIAPLLLALWAVPYGIAYWCTYQGRDGNSAPFNRAACCGLVVVAVLLGCAWWDGAHWPVRSAGCGLQPQRWWLWLAAAAMTLLGVAYAAATAVRHAKIAEQRVFLTRHLAAALTVVGLVLAVGLIDTAGQTLYLVSHRPSGASPLTLTSLVAALVWLAKKGAASLSRPAAGSLLQKLPLTTLGGLAGVLILFLVASLWGFVVHALAWAGRVPMADGGDGAQSIFLVVLTALTVAMAFLAGQFPGFINLSSLQSFYSARLVRAYLGASNGKRFATGGASLSVAEPMPEDNLQPERYLSADGTALSTLAPLHVVNVTLNKTVDPAEQLVQRDRKGQPLAVLPFGFAVDGRCHPFPDHVAQYGRWLNEVQRPLTVGQWVGISGAAVSTGIGRETSLGMSLLMGAANVRLGVWWDSGRGKDKTADGPLAGLTGAVGWLFRTQTYLSYEFRARFFGLHRRWQYLSDGGHFENTGLYELLRPERKVGFVLASDNGADPNYAFGDLANLIRLVRIDFGLELSVVRDFHAWPVLDAVFGAPEDFAPTAPARTHSALLLRAVPQGGTQVATWVVLLKPVVGPAAPADLRQYVLQRPAFPQEPTMDQFFDEAQWESYRSLGHATAARVLAAPVWQALAGYMRLYPNA